LIAFRLIQNENRLSRVSVRRVMQSRVTGALVVVIESAAVYSAGLTCLVTVYLLGSNGQYAILDLTATIAGITFHFIILRALFTRDVSIVYSSGAMASTAHAIPLDSRSKGLTVNVNSVVVTSDQPYGYDSGKPAGHSRSLITTESV
ncbi:hypothetical protein AAF712_015320, partial [Marasmius tenuissimus]